MDEKQDAMMLAQRILKAKFNREQMALIKELLIALQDEKKLNEKIARDLGVLERKYNTLLKEIERMKND